MEFIKSADGEIVSAVDDAGRTVAYIEKARLGTHGHWKGWWHYRYCYYENKCIRGDVWCRAVYPGWKDGYGYFNSWTDAPAMFANIREFKKYYGEEKNGRA